MTTPDLLAAWRDAKTAADLAERLATAALEAVLQAQANAALAAQHAALAGEIAELAKETAEAAARAAERARDAVEVNRPAVAASVAPRP